MKNQRPTRLAHRLLASTAMALAAAGALAQASTPLAQPSLPASAASAPGTAARVGPRLRSAAETGNRAAAPGELHPERPVTPQISIPFGKKAAPAARHEERAPPRADAAKVGVDDAAARCESQADARVRASCRARLAREAKGHLPD